MNDTGSGELLLEGSGRELGVRFRGRPLYPPAAPRAMSERIASEARILPGTLVLIPSPLLGYGLEALLRRLPQGSAVLLLEAEPSLENLSRERVPASVFADARVRLAPAVPEAAVFAARGLGRFRRTLELSLTRGRSLAPRIYDAIKAALDADASEYWRNRATMMRMGRLWTRNLLDNVGRLERVRLRPLPRSLRPVLVLGAGPSLDALAPWILSERERLSLLAVDTALPALRARGLEPDAVVALEGQAHNLRDFSGGDGSRLRVFADLSSHPATFRHLGGPIHLLGTRWDELAFLDRAHALPFMALKSPPLGSVGVLAVSIALELGPVPVLLAGLDFAYPPGRSHAAGSPAIEAERSRESRLYRARAQWASAFGGRAARSGRADERSDPLLGAYAGMLARLLAPSARRVLDLRPGGLDLGLARGGTEEATALLDAFGAARGGPAFEDGAAFDADVGGEAARAFLEGERALVLDLRLALRGASREELLGLTARADGYWAHFPDAEGASELAQHFLNRLLVESCYWQDRIERALGFLGA